jgi:hypothetical protein
MSIIFWDVTWSVQNKFTYVPEEELATCFLLVYFLHLFFNRDDGDSMLLLNVSELLSDHIKLYPRRQLLYIL